MGATFIGVRHHSPACARLVVDTIEQLRPAYVLVEGPADMNDRLDELLLDHELPVAVFTSYRDADRQHASWAPFCAYSPEWVALSAGREVAAQVRFIDLPAWHPAFAGRRNRYADAEQRYADVVERLCRTFAVDNVDTLWDHLFEVPPADDLAERLAVYFDLVRGESAAGPQDTQREEYMARWVRAAVADAGDRPVVVVTGGFHRPALIRLTAQGGTSDTVWPAMPGMPNGATGGSYLVPYSFRRLDAFDGYQSGMPSPDYYQQLWDAGPHAAADHLVAAVVGRLRDRRQPVSTADLIAARATADGLARIRGHQHPARVDILDGLAAALVNEALDVALPWSTRGTLTAGTHPAIVEMVAALSGDRVGRLHPTTPLPPLVHNAHAELERHGLDRPGDVRLRLTDVTDRERSRILHRLRVLRIPGFTRHAGPATGIDPVLDEDWTVRADDNRLPALIEAGGYGRELDEAATAVLAERIGAAAGDVTQLAGALFDAALCGSGDLSDRILQDVTRAVAAAADLGALGRVLAVALALWRHDHLLGAARSGTLGAVIAAGVQRILWLAEGVRGGIAPADGPRIDALVAVRDALVHAGPALTLDPGTALDVAARIAADADAPPDLRGAAFGFGWSLRAEVEPVRAVRGAYAPASVGDWLAGLFALAREEVLAADGVLGLLDDLVSGMGEDDFLVALPALRQAFAYFPPRERETIARHVLSRRGVAASARALLRLPTAPDLVAAGRALDQRVDVVLTREGLVSA
ncbi:hypothetical protein EV384_5322 [Micromonospora kangleipakensis]|uniref:Uncharacterized protein n=1 Tax=Micromonospora kangleipakensis TaxID=1077942 RepID=A0A4Q8BGS4_9ACTN|nr:DUF5682 family protein [Micromonospora kangleipakensis]RZU76655.1 hypothetical protein EV384_5322 [Micromonospora kangleipakensis]